jgi:hypothetical protein
MAEAMFFGHAYLPVDLVTAAGGGAGKGGDPDCRQ